MPDPVGPACSANLTPATGARTTRLCRPLKRRSSRAPQIAHEVHLALRLPLHALRSRVHRIPSRVRDDARSAPLWNETVRDIVDSEVSGICWKKASINSRGRHAACRALPSRGNTHRARRRRSTPRHFAAWDVLNGRLVKPFDVGLRLSRTYWIVCPKATSTKPKITIFRDWLLAEAADDARRLKKMFAETPAR